MIILDTNVVSGAMRPLLNPVVQSWLDTQINTDLYLATTSLAELRLGIEILPEGRRRSLLASELDWLLEQVFADRVLPFDANAARAYGEVVSRARRRGRPIEIADGQIAAIATVHGFSVATRDTSPFEAARVAVINPWES